MIRPLAAPALFAASLAAAACQTMVGGNDLAGRWASTNGVFVASFADGRFTSRFTKTNEVLAEGTYRTAGGGVTLDWLSVATQQRRSAACRFAAPDRLRCDQPGATSFELRRA